MLFSVLFATLAIVPLAVAVPSTSLASRQTTDLSSEVIADINTIISSITTLNNTLNTFEPDAILGLLTALQIQQQTTDVENNIVTATQDTNSSTAWNADESNSVAAAVLKLEPMIQSLLTNLVAHKPAFATAVLFVGDLSETVEGDLEKQRELSREFGDAVTAKLASPYSDFAPLVTGQILGYFDTAIQKYSTCSGVLCLPDVSGIP